MKAGEGKRPGFKRLGNNLGCMDCYKTMDCYTVTIQNSATHFSFESLQKTVDYYKTYERACKSERVQRKRESELLHCNNLKDFCNSPDMPRFLRAECNESKRFFCSKPGRFPSPAFTPPYIHRCKSDCKKYI